MDLYKYPYTQPEAASNPIVAQTVTLADNVVSFQYECADGGTMNWSVDLNEIKARPDYRNHTCFVLCPDGSISNLWEDVVKLGIKNTEFFAAKKGYIASVVVHDAPKEDPVISMVFTSPTGITPELVGDLAVVGETDLCQYPLGSTNTNP